MKKIAFLAMLAIVGHACGMMSLMRFNSDHWSLTENHRIGSRAFNNAVFTVVNITGIRTASESFREQPLKDIDARNWSTLFPSVDKDEVEALLKHPADFFLKQLAQNLAKAVKDKKSSSQERFFFTVGRAYIQEYVLSIYAPGHPAIDLLETCFRTLGDYQGLVELFRRYEVDLQQELLSLELSQDTLGAEFGFAIGPLVPVAHLLGTGQYGAALVALAPHCTKTPDTLCAELAVARDQRDVALGRLNALGGEMNGLESRIAALQAQRDAISYDGIDLELAPRFELMKECGINIGKATSEIFELTTYTGFDPGERSNALNAFWTHWSGLMDFLCKCDADAKTAKYKILDQLNSDLVALSSALDGLRKEYTKTEPLASQQTLKDNLVAILLRYGALLISSMEFPEQPDRQALSSEAQPTQPTAEPATPRFVLPQADRGGRGGKGKGKRRRT
ncbi:MAG: hypothetical protein LBF54_00435 [Holosporaceae bacterium]|jgi:VIT1/CCC1 family predicted Fe2+/Mn2+ transporter|nr:hypothetical protein [Holosporaceae bacterium]